MKQRIFFVFEPECRFFPWQVSRSCPELLNLESRSIWRCQWSTLSLQWLYMIVWTWVWSSWRFSAVSEIGTRDRVFEKNVWTIIGRSAPHAYLSYFFVSQLWFIEFFSSARGFWIMTRGSKSLQFKARSSKNSMTSQLSGSSARKFRKCSPTCVDEAINLSLCLMSSSVSTPFSMARWSVNCDLLFCQWGVSARNNGTLRSPKRWWLSGFEARPLVL